MVLGFLARLGGRTALRGAGRFGGRSRALVPFGFGAGGGLLGSAFGGGGDGEGRRRRRRKALTNDDVKTALTIASAISKKAAENFILMRVRGS